MISLVDGYGGDLVVNSVKLLGSVVQVERATPGLSRKV